MTTIELTVERGTDDDWLELTVEVRGTVTREQKATLLDPAEGGEVEIDSVTCGGEDFELTPRELTKASELLVRQAREDALDSSYARADRELDERREARFW